MQLTGLTAALTQQFEPALLAELEHLASIRMAKPGEVLVEAGAPVLFVPIVLQGSIKILRPNTDSDDGEMLLYYLNPSDSCALSFNSLLTGQLSQIRAVVEENARVLMIPVVTADDWMSRYPRWRTFVSNVPETVRQPAGNARLGSLPADGRAID